MTDAILKTDTLSVAGECGTTFYDFLELEARHFVDESRFLALLAGVASDSHDPGQVGFLCGSGQDDQPLVTLKGMTLTLRKCRVRIQGGLTFDLSQPLVLKSDREIGDSAMCYLKIWCLRAKLNTPISATARRFRAEMAWEPRDPEINGRWQTASDNQDERLLGFVKLAHAHGLPWLVHLNAEPEAVRLSKELGDLLKAAVTKCHAIASHSKLRPRVVAALTLDVAAFAELHTLLRDEYCRPRSLLRALRTVTFSLAENWDFLRTQESRKTLKLLAHKTEQETSQLISFIRSFSEKIGRVQAATVEDSLLYLFESTVEFLLDYDELLNAIIDAPTPWNGEPPEHFKYDNHAYRRLKSTIGATSILQTEIKATTQPLLLCAKLISPAHTPEITLTLRSIHAEIGRKTIKLKVAPRQSPPMPPWVAFEVFNPKDLLGLIAQQAADHDPDPSFQVSIQDTPDEQMSKLVDRRTVPIYLYERLG